MRVVARIRTIKPEMPHSETLGKVSREARLLFVNLFTIADDEGRARASSRLLASLLYPYDDDAPHLMDDWLSDLNRVEAIRLYEVDGVRYLDIPKWLEHQKIDRPSKSRLPAYSAEAREASRSLDALPSTLDLVPTPCKPPRGGDAYSADFEKWWEAYPNKVGKDAAWKKWKAAIKRVDLETLLAAAKRYIANKPLDREWCNPATWLHQGRWQDAPAGAVSVVTLTTSVDPEESQWEARCKNWRPGRYWNRDQWGPAPNEPGCKAPKRFLHEPEARPNITMAG